MSSMYGLGILVEFGRKYAIKLDIINKQNALTFIHIFTGVKCLMKILKHFTEKPNLDNSNK